MCIGRLGANICSSFRKLSFITICGEVPTPQKNEVPLLFLFLRVECPFCVVCYSPAELWVSLFSPANGFIIAVTPPPRPRNRGRRRRAETVQIGLKHELVSLELPLLLVWPASPVQREIRLLLHTIRLFFS